MSGRGFRAIASPIGILLGLAAPASAAESYCVSCSGPQASYLCEVSVPDGVVVSQSPQLYCAYRLASEGHHASCASRRADASSCQGEPRKLAYEGPSLVAPGTMTTPAVTMPAAAPDKPALPADATALEPEMGDTTTDQAVDPAASPEPIAPADDDDGKDASRVGEEDVAIPADEAAPSTGDKIAGAAKTAFNCLASFFKECKE